MTVTVDYLKNLTRKLWGVSKRGEQREDPISTLAVGSARFVSLIGYPKTEKGNSDRDSPVRSRPPINIEGMGIGFPHGLDGNDEVLADKNRVTCTIRHAISQARRMADRNKTAPHGVSLYLSVCGSAKPPRQLGPLNEIFQGSASAAEENQVYLNRLMDYSLAGQIINCIHSLGAEVKDVVFELYGVGKAILTFEEKAEGVAVIDMGKRFTDLAIYRQGYITYANSIPHAGDDINRAISRYINIDLWEAEVIKQQVGTLNLLPTHNEKEISPIQVQSGTYKDHEEIDPAKAARIIRLEVENILDTVFADLGQNDPHSSPLQTVVLTGNSSLIDGLVPLIRNRYGMLARREGVPPGFSGLAHLLDEPRYHSSFGLLRYGVEYDQESSKEH